MKKSLLVVTAIVVTMSFATTVSAATVVNGAFTKNAAAVCIGYGARCLTAEKSGTAAGTCTPIDIDHDEICDYANGNSHHGQENHGNGGHRGGCR